MNRRDALRLMGGAVAFALGPAATRAAQAHAAQAVAAAGQGQAYAPKFFTPHEWRTVRLLVDLILPRDERSGSATDVGVPEFMDFVMTDPEEEDRSLEWRQTAMRGGLAWIDAECRHRFGHAFDECTDAEQRALLDDIAYPKDEDDEEPVDYLFHVPSVRLRHGPAFFSSFRDLTASGFWSSRMGVEDLGYLGNVPFEWQGPPPEVLQRIDSLPSPRAAGRGTG